MSQTRPIDPNLFFKLEQEQNSRASNLTSNRDIPESLSDFTWAFGLEQEGTYVLNPLDTSGSWDNSFKHIYALDGETLSKWVDTDEERRESYPIVGDKESVESSGRYCENRWVVKSNPRYSILEISTKEPYGVTTFRSYFATDILWYPARIEEIQAQLLGELDNLYYTIPLFQRKKKKFRSIVPYPYGMTDRMISADTLFKSQRTKPKPATNYTGSYHVTITLPFRYQQVNLAEYRESYKRYINQIQWVEPLLLAMYSTIDMRGIGSHIERSRGSYRVMITGWGNPGGSDIRNLDKGFKRYNDIPLYWREGLDFPGTKELDYACVKQNLPKLHEEKPGAISWMGTDIRTFWRGKGEKKKKGTDEYESEVKSGAPIDKLFGIEIRIFDYFPAKKLYSLCRFLIFLAENSRRTPATHLVYQDPAWINAMHSMMKYGWRAILSIEYIEKLEETLDIKLSKKNRMASEVWKNVLDELYHKNKDGWYVRVMLPQKLIGDPDKKDEQANMNIGKRKQPPLTFHNVNRESWDFGFLMKMMNEPSITNKLRNVINSLPIEQNIARERLDNLFFKHFTKKSWEQDMEDIFYFLQWRSAITILKDESGMFNGVNITTEQKIKALEIVENKLGELIKLWPELLHYAKG